MCCADYAYVVCADILNGGVCSHIRSPWTVISKFVPSVQEAVDGLIRSGGQSKSIVLIHPGSYEVGGVARIPPDLNVRFERGVGGLG